MLVESSVSPSLFPRSVLLALLLTATLAPVTAGAALDGDRRLEFATPDAESPPPHETDPEAEILLAVQSLSQEGMHDTYGVLPALGLGLSWRVGPDTRLGLALRYATSGGQVYGDTPLFEGGPEARLSAVPLTVDLRRVEVLSSRWRLNVGAAVQLAWISERIPDRLDPAHLKTYGGIGGGLMMFLGPEWRFDDGRRAMGLTLAWGGSGASLGSSGDTIDSDLSGVHARLHYVFSL